MEQSDILLDTSYPIATLTLNRPEFKNALSPNLMRNLLKALNLIKQDTQIKVVILTAKGKDFCSGADIHWMKQSKQLSAEENKADAAIISEVLQTFVTFPKPIIGQIQGCVYGGAVGLVACCDIVYALANTTFCLSEVKLGLSPAIIAPYVVQAIGDRWSRYWMLSAIPFSAEDALQAGLVHFVLPNLEQLTQQVSQCCQQLTCNGPQAMYQTKLLLNRISEALNTGAITDHSIELIAKLRHSAEGQEGLNAFLEKRKPNWP